MAGWPGGLAGLRLGDGARCRAWSVPPTLLQAVLAGLVSVLAVLIGQHWLGALVAIGLFAYLCARDSGTRAWT